MTDIVMYLLPTSRLKFGQIGELQVVSAYLESAPNLGLSQTCRSGGWVDSWVFNLLLDIFK